METNFDHIFARLFPLLGKRIIRNRYLAPYTTFRVGGPASLFLTVNNRYELLEVLGIFGEQVCSFFILGGGSNLLISDRGFPGAVVSLAQDFSYVRKEDSNLVAGAATRLGRCTKFAQEVGLRGLAFTAGIPGTLGGAIAVNAGAYGSSIGDVLRNARIVSLENGKEMIISKKDCGFSYRSTNISGKTVITEAILDLKEDNPDNVLKEIRELLDRRKKTQPIGMYTAGSIFKNPPGEYAGKLIEEADCKGVSIGDAFVSDVHANFIVNRGKASSQDIYNLIRLVQERVYEKTDIVLEMEIVTLGKFGNER